MGKAVERFGEKMATKIDNAKMHRFIGFKVKEGKPFRVISIDKGSYVSGVD